MTFTYKNAIKIRDFYESLKGKELSAGRNVTYVCIVPENEKQLSVFSSHLNQNDDPEQSLLYSGFDANSVRVLVIHHDRFGGNLLTSDIDKYLDRNNIQKCYDEDGVFIES